MLRAVLMSLFVLSGLSCYLHNRHGCSGKTSGTIADDIEIGLWTFVVDSLRIFGLRHITASHGAALFPNQFSTDIVRFVAALFDMELSIGYTNFVASVLSGTGVASFQWMA